MGPTDEAEAHFDLREVEVVPDRDAIWNAVLETAAQPQYVRRIGVRTVAELFHGPEPRVSLIRVNLQRGGGPIVSVDLTEQQLAAEALLSSPLRDYVLGRADPGVFQYQVLTVRGGMRTPTSAWKESSTNLIITTEDLVATMSLLGLPDFQRPLHGFKYQIYYPFENSGSFVVASSAARNRQHESRVDLTSCWRWFAE